LQTPKKNMSATAAVVDTLLARRLVHIRQCAGEWSADDANRVAAQLVADRPLLAAIMRSFGRHDAAPTSVHQHLAARAMALCDRAFAVTPRCAPVSVPSRLPSVDRRSIAR
jgi:hypothetical protein